jgi:hypothetical protein
VMRRGASSVRFPSRSKTVFEAKKMRRDCDPVC